MIQELLTLAKEQSLKFYTSTADWSQNYYQLVSNKVPFEKALYGGFTCQQFSFVFLAGYQAALEHMFPQIAPNKLKALCVSEQNGGHPKAIQTTLIDYQLDGVKTYVTAGTDAEHLLVLCKTNEVINGKPQLKLVHLPKTANGTELTNFELAFMKDVKHGKLAMQSAKITNGQILKGDGFSDYAKPFRTLEDICVGTAYQAMLLRQAIECEWDADLRDSILLSLYTLKNLLKLPLLDAETHILLTRNEANFKQLLPNIEANIAATTSTQFQADWQMNKKLIGMSKKLKDVRLAKARQMAFG